MTQSPTPTILSLAELKTGEHATLYEIQGGRGIVFRLGPLGFTPGVEIEMTQNYGRGPLIVTVRGTRVAMGREEARRTMVKKGEA